MKLCTYNILEGGVGRIDPLAEVIRLSGAQIVVLQECWDAALFHKLADRLNMDRFLAENPKNREGATGLLTTWEIREAINHAPLDMRLTRSAFHAVVRRKSVESAGTSAVQEWAIIGLHLHARETYADEEARMNELPAILEIGKALQASGPKSNLLLAGDFNASHPQQHIDLTKLRPKSRERVNAQGGVLPREVITRILDAGYVDAHAIGRQPEEFGTSMTTSHPAMRTDYIFATAAMAGRVRSCDVFKPELARFASDHFPVVADIAD